MAAPVLAPSEDYEGGNSGIIAPARLSLKFFLLPLPSVGGEK